MTTSPSNETCYQSNDAVATGAIPCNPQAGSTTCCRPTDLCYNNGLCGPGPGLPNGGETPYYTGYCTDRSWINETECPSICNNQPGSNIGGNGVQFCGKSSYCCYDYSRADCCQTSSLLFSLAAITSSTQLPNLTASATHITSSFSATTDATTTTSSSLVPSSTPAPAISPTSLPSTLPKSSNHFGAGVGAGVGAAAALILLVGLFYFFRRRRTIDRVPQTYENPGYGEKVDMTDMRMQHGVHEMDGQKGAPAESDGRDIVEIDTMNNTGHGLLR